MNALNDLRAKVMSGPSGWLLSALLSFLCASQTVQTQGTRLLREPAMSAQHVAFVYGADLWIADRTGGVARRLTSTPAVESDPYFSPDGSQLAFTSNRSGIEAVYVVPVEGGEPVRLTWYPSSARARGWTPDGGRVLYASTREAAPSGYDRLWTVPAQGGAPSEPVPAPRGTAASFVPEGDRLVVERISRWDVEWRAYRGGQNVALTILDLEDLEEIDLPNERTTDRWPVWMGDTVFFLSDRDWTMNIWAYNVTSGALEQRTEFDGADIKSLKGGDGMLVFERDGYVHVFDPSSGEVERLEIEVRGDFPWANERWENVTGSVSAAAISPTGKRAVFEARGEIFTAPTEHGDARNLSNRDDAADRSPVWSPDGARVAWFSDRGGQGYRLVVAPQDGLGEERDIDIGDSKMAWEVTWSPDGRHIAFVDNAVRVRIVDVEQGRIATADTGTVSTERGEMGLTWSPDSKWLAYAKTAPNRFRKITVWSVDRERARGLTDPLADAFAPAWDRDGRHLYFLASTDYALGSGWANTSTMQADPEYGAYVMVLREGDPSPFPPRSDEEAVEDAEDESEEAKAAADSVEVVIDADGIERRTVALPMPVRRYRSTVSGPKGTVFFAESPPGGGGTVLHKFVLEDRKAEEFMRGVQYVSVSADGKKLLVRSGSTWRVVDTASPPDAGSGALSFTLRMRLDRRAEWRQIFEEAWRYERDYFYDPGMHGRDWDEVYDRYAPLVEYVRHRDDLTYILDQMNGELSVGHSFVRGGDYPAVDTVRVGVLGADLVAENGRWRFDRILTAESWNPDLSAPLDRPGLDVEEGDYLVGVNGTELSAGQDPFMALDGTADRQTVLHVNDEPAFEGARQVTVVPLESESGLRRRAWVEDNRRRVDELSGGRLAYVWVPNTSQQGVVSFDRYFFAQQDRYGAVIDERFNGGGLLDDYMVDLMTRQIRAAITNEAPGGKPFVLPAGILGPKVLLVNEMAGSGGDFFPWVFRQQQAGPLIGTRTWGGLVRSSVHYRLVDGGYLTAPDNAVFDPINNTWIGENEGIPPDIEVRMDARAVAEGRDPQLERGVEEALRLLEQEGVPSVTPPPFSTPAVPGEQR